jgi:hypothetical protein
MEFLPVRMSKSKVFFWEITPFRTVQEPCITSAWSRFGGEGTNHITLVAVGRRRASVVLRARTNPMRTERGSIIVRKISILDRVRLQRTRERQSGRRMIHEGESEKILQCGRGDQALHQ